MESYVESLNQFFWNLAIFTLFAGSFLFLAYSLRKKDKEEKLLMLGFTSVAFGLALNQFFRFLSTTLIFIENSLDLISILSYAVGFTLFFLIFDKTLKKVRYIPFIINLVLNTLIIIFFTMNLSVPPRLFVYISYLFNATAFCLVLLWFSRRSEEKYKETSFFLLTGALVYLIGAIMQSIFIEDLISRFPIIIYSLMVAGAIIFTYPLLFQTKRSSKFKYSLIFCSIICIILVFLALYFSIYLLLFYQIHYVFFITMIVMICGSSITIIYFLRNFRKPSKNSEITKMGEKNGLKINKQNIDILKIFSNRELNTKDEISLFKSFFKEEHAAKGSKLTHDDILQNETRKRIYHYINENLIAYTHQIIKSLNLPTQTVIWHVNLLFSFNFISRIRIEEHYNHYIYYKKDLSSKQAKKLYFINNQKCKEILECLKNYDDGCSKTHLARQLGMHPNTIKKYLKILEELEIINKKKQGNGIIYQLN